MKHNHDKRSTCCPLKLVAALCQETLLKKLDLDIGKKIIKNKNKLSSYCWLLLFMNLIYSNKEIV